MFVFWRRLCGVTLVALVGTTCLVPLPTIAQPAQKDRAKPQREEPLEPDRLAPLPTTNQAVLQLRPGKVTLAETLVSVDRHYPLLVAARRERDVAAGQFVSAQGEFDFRVNGHTLFNTDSFDNQRYRLGFTQPTAWNGVTVGGGYRLGAGNYPVYYQDRQTAEGGEFSLGLAVPLLRDRAIDPRRGKLQQASLTRELAEPTIARDRIGFLRDASKAYWNWVGASRRMEIGQQLLTLAEERDSFLRKLTQRGTIAGIEVTDNLRTVYDRRARLVQLRRAFEQSAIALSLYLRDEAGCPLELTETDQAPLFPSPRSPELTDLEVQLRFALSRRPELQQLLLQQQKIRVDLALAENSALPRVNVVLNAAQDVGQEKSSLDRSTYSAGITVEVPLQRRQAHGRLMELQAKLAQLQARSTFLQQQITTQVQTAYSSVLRAYEAYQRAQTGVRLAERMAQAEVRKLEIGRSSILFVNLRELARADAQALLVGTLLDYYQAIADFRSVLGLSTLEEWLHRPLVQTRSPNLSEQPSQ